jgi:3-hydroxyisobutyrate dehydrogenase-like beta-hydroxyacid dehydrogenase
MDVGFIGIGIMGSGMATSLLREGHKVTVFNRTPAKAKALGDKGAEVAGSLADAAGKPVLISMLADDPAIETLYAKGNDIREMMPADGIHMAMGTISAEMSRQLTKRHAEAGQVFLACPVLGRGDMAEAGKLFIMAAGPKDKADLCEPLIEAMSQRWFYFGPEPYQASTVKLCANFMLAAAIETMGEAFAVVEKAGMDKQDFYEFFTNTSFNTIPHKVYGKLIADDNYLPANFTLKLGLKDMTLAAKAAEDLDVSLPLANLIREQMYRAMARGEHDQDWSVIGRVSARSAGLQK